MVPSDADPRIHVVAAVLNDDAGRILIAQRPAGTHMAGRWEFPGGKLEADESRGDGLKRELEEELGIHLLEARPLIRCCHRYPDRHVELDVWLVTDYTGEPEGRDKQTLRWVTEDELADVDLLEADAPIVAAIRLPSRYLITKANVSGNDFLERLSAALETHQILMTQLRLPGLEVIELNAIARRAVGICHEFGSKVLINGDPKHIGRIIEDSGADGIHLPWRYCRQFDSRSGMNNWLVGVSCHNETELQHATKIGANFAVLGPVNHTRSHAEAEPLGWSSFGKLVGETQIPVYALGGVTNSDMITAWNAGAQGIAAISAFWPESLGR